MAKYKMSCLVGSTPACHVKLSVFDSRHPSEFISGRHTPSPPENIQKKMSYRFIMSYVFITGSIVGQLFLETSWANHFSYILVDTVLWILNSFRSGK
jgi:hypothetical protein